MGSPFESIVGAAHVSAPPAPELDGIPVEQVVHPGSVDEVAECLRLAARDQIAVLPCGGGSKLRWGNVGAPRRWVLLSLARLVRPFEIDADEGIARLAAGVRVDALAERLRAVGRRSRIPDSFAGATVGGSVAADPPAPQRSPDAMLRDDLLGLEAVLASGVRTRCGGQVVKNVTGFDLVRLYCGSFGTLGILTEVVLRVRPLPEAQSILARALASIEDAQAALAVLTRCGVDPQSAVLARRAEGAGVELMWLLEGTEADVCERRERFPGDPVEAADWRRACAIADAAPDGIPPWAQADPALVRLRLGARPGDLPSLWRGIEQHAGSGAPQRAFPLLGTVWAHCEPGQLAPLLETATRLDWAWLIESLPARLKPGVEIFGPPPAALPLMRALKQRFDPGGLLAPGRFWGGI